MDYSTLQVEVRAGVRVEPEVQGGQVHHRARPHDQGERMGERELKGRREGLNEENEEKSLIHWKSNMS